MKHLLALILLSACAPPADLSGASYALCDDAGAPDATTPSGTRWYGEQGLGGDPIVLGHWEYPAPTAQAPQSAGVLRLGSGVGGLGYDAVRITQIDSRDQTSFMLKGVQVMKLQDHPTTGGPLLHLGGVPDLWFGNSLRETAQILYQGTNYGAALKERADDLEIVGQTMNATGAATAAIGGDVIVRGGDASMSAGLDVPRTPGNVCVRGGNVLNVTRGNVALHGLPASWEGMEGGVFIRDAATPPSGTPTGGGYLYPSGGALYWVGSAGTVTMVAPP